MTAKAAERKEFCAIVFVAGEPTLIESVKAVVELPESPQERPGLIEIVDELRRRFPEAGWHVLDDGGSVTICHRTGPVDLCVSAVDGELELRLTPRR